MLLVTCTITSCFYFAYTDLDFVFSHLQLVRGNHPGRGLFLSQDCVVFCGEANFRGHPYVARCNAGDKEAWGGYIE